MEVMICQDCGKGYPFDPEGHEGAYQSQCCQADLCGCDGCVAWKERKRGDPE